MKERIDTAPFLSICIPAYEMTGSGRAFLKHSLDILTKQSFQDFEVVISDHSKNDDIKKLCEEYKKKLQIHYYKNTEDRGSSSANLNNAIQKASGALIKILFQDDFLYSEQSLQEIVDAFDLSKDEWLVTACEHSNDGKNFYRPFYPKYNHKIHLGKNTISSPSVLTIKNDHPLLFDPELKWLMDCDYYKRCHETFGAPKILNRITVVNRTGAHQVSNTLATKELKEKEYQYVVEKFGKGKQKLSLKNVTLVAVSSVKIERTIRALELSMNGIEYYDVMLISHEKPQHLPKNITFKKCDPIRNIDEYSKFMAYDLAKHIKSEFALVIQYDGYVLRPHKWRDSFFNYDYIGAPWPKDQHFTNEGLNVRVGNGGFSLRSQKMLNALNKLKLPFTDNGTGYYNEDGLLCLYYRKEMEAYSIKYAPVEVAAKFSHELDCPESDPEPFGFHRNTKVIPRLHFVKHYLKKKRIRA